MQILQMLSMKMIWQMCVFCLSDRN